MCKQPGCLDIPDRRTFLQSLSAGAVRPKTASVNFPDILRPPDYAAIRTPQGQFPLLPQGGHWRRDDVIVDDGAGRVITIESPRTALEHVLLRWRATFPANARFLGDHWERSYGDLEWRSSVPDRVMPWYFLASSGDTSRGYGVGTGAAAIAFWQVDPEGISLWLDVRNGGDAVQLGERRLAAAMIRQTSAEPGRTPFDTARALCAALSPKPCLPGAPVYGGNNWYYTYGANFTAADILRDAKLMADLAPSTHSRPFMVIDAGWTRADRGAGPVTSTRDGFPDMAKLADAMKAAGARPGIWMRPLLTVEKLSENWRLPASAGRAGVPYFVLDPSVPEALEHIRMSAAEISRWGYELIKHDYSTFDLLGRWGFQMGVELTAGRWHFHDRTRTTAEIIRALYQTLRDAAGNAMLIGCNTAGHLGAGLFQLQRIGDDTSGKQWERTRKMGVNTLAFRAAQHQTFFSADPDCVPVTPPISWTFTRQWLDLVARSGMPLFVSLDPSCAGNEQRRAIREAFTVAAVPQPVPEPLDWMNSTAPEHWKLGGVQRNYHWYPEDGAPAFVR